MFVIANPPSREVRDLYRMHSVDPLGEDLARLRRAFSLPGVLVPPIIVDFENTRGIWLPSEAAPGPTLMVSNGPSPLQNSYLASRAVPGFETLLSRRPIASYSPPPAPDRSTAAPKPWKRIKRGFVKRIRVNKQALFEGGPEHFVVEFNGATRHFEEVEILGKSKMAWSESTSYRGCMPETKRSAWLETSAALRVR